MRRRGVRASGPSQERTGESGAFGSLEGLMLKLKLQYFGHLMRRADSLEKTLMLGKIEGRRRRRQQMMRWMTEDEMVGYVGGRRETLVSLAFCRGP